MSVSIAKEKCPKCSQEVEVKVTYHSEEAFEIFSDHECGTPVLLCSGVRLLVWKVPQK